MMWSDIDPHDRLNKFYNFYTAAVVVSLIDMTLELKTHKNQPEKTKLVLYKPLLRFKRHLKQLISDKMAHFSCKDGCGICVSRCLKEELA